MVDADGAFLGGVSDPVPLQVDAEGAALAGGLPEPSYRPGPA